MKKVEIPENLDQRHPAYGGYNTYNQLIDISENLKDHNEELLLKLIEDNKDTEFGKKYDFENIKSIEDFKAKVPFSSYDTYAESIDRMTRGEKNILTAYPIVHYAVTSGSVDNPKNIPVSDRTMQIYSKYASGLAQFTYDHDIRELKGRAPNPGKQFPTAFIKIGEVEDGTTRGPISAAIYMQMKPMMKYVLPWPLEVTYLEDKELDLKYLKAFYGLKDRNITSFQAPFMPALVDTMYYIEKNWESLVDDIEKGIISPEISLDPELREKFQAELEPDPERAAELREIFEAGFDKPIIPQIWPLTDYIAAIGGGGFATYTNKMRDYSGDIPIYFNSYAASEALMAVAVELEKEAYVMVPENGFFEFIPVDSEDETQTLNMDELEEGKEYEIIITNLSGFYRYKLGDVIEVIDHFGDIPVIKFKYRKNQMINLAGEKTNEAALAWTIKALEEESGVPITDYSIYADSADLPGRYVLLIEPQQQQPKENRAKLRDIADEKMGIANPSYGSKVHDSILLPMDLKFVQPETYYLYRDLLLFKGVSENQIKPVHVIDTPRKEKFFFSLLDEE